MSNDEYRALQQLKNMRSVEVKQADKGGGIVLLDRDLYISQMRNLLLNTQVYTCINRTKANGIIDRVSFLILNLLITNLIDESLFKYFTTENPVIPKIHGLPKMHKKNAVIPPMRPIASGTGWCTQPLSIFVEGTLHVFLDECYTIL